MSFLKACSLRYRFYSMYAACLVLPPPNFCNVCVSLQVNKVNALTACCAIIY